MLRDLRKRHDRKTAAQFVSSEGPRLHQGFGGHHEFDATQGKLVDPKPYKHLEEAMRQYIPTSSLGIQFSGDAWGDLFDKLSGTESEYHDNNSRNTKKLFWWNLGELREHINPWLALIPDHHGLSVVKASIALLLKLAEDSVEKRDKIYDAFASLRNRLQKAQSQRKSFRADPYISECANHLYLALVDAIEELILFVTPGRHRHSWRRWIPRFEQNPKPQEPELILQVVDEKANALELAVGQTRDKVINNIDRSTKNTDARLNYVAQDVKSAEVNTRKSLNKHDETLNKLSTQDEVLRDVRDMVKRAEEQHVSMFDKLVVEIHKGTNRMADEIAKSTRIDMHENTRIAMHENTMIAAQCRAANEMINMLIQSKKPENRNARIQYQPRRRPAVVNAERLVEILGLSNNHFPNSATSQAILEHPSNDLKRALLSRKTFKQSAQAQAQSLLRRRQFTNWVGQHHPDLISVEGNIASATLDMMSAVSVICATLAACLRKVNPNGVVVHFFCGLHNHLKDNWHGPNGLLRSIIMQILMNLNRLRRLDLDFINDREYLRDLEDHNLFSLCDTLRSLLSQFPAGTDVYCIIDGISFFDTRTTKDDLIKVICCLRDIVEYRFLVPVFKVLMTTPKRYSMRVKELLDPEGMVMLSSSNLFSTEISYNLVESRLLRQSNPRVFTLGQQNEVEDLDYATESVAGYETD